MIEKAKVWAESAKMFSYFQKMALSISYFFRSYGGLLIAFWIYTYLDSCLQIIAGKTNTENGWLAWIPIANIYLSCKIARKPGWWLLLFFNSCSEYIYFNYCMDGNSKSSQKI